MLAQQSVTKSNYSKIWYL